MLFLTIKFEIEKTMKLRNPLCVNKTHAATIASRETLDEAVITATEDMAELFRTHSSLPVYETAMLMSAAGNARICQVVDPLKTVRFEMPRRILESYGIRF